MKKVDFKKLGYLPEILLLAGAVFAFFEELIRTSVVNYFAIACIALLAILLIWKNRWLALSISIVLGLVSFYFILACYSEFKEFPAGDNDGIRMLLTGCLLFGSLIAISFIMPRKYFAETSI
ncbi:hypothetical protein FACS189440_13970 [Bacteroidia bacterium]|nr:hypothetical protein FACS189423_07270 [Bacteroidia bacterium]GHT49035.1 hypothetical protein FACS189440_13970 [Bacteroidia bacterium]